MFFLKVAMEAMAVINSMVGPARMQAALEKESLDPESYQQVHHQTHQLF